MKTRDKKVKALALLSGGLDSTLAVRIILDQGIAVEAVNFTSPFCLCKSGGCGAIEAAKSLKIPLKTINVGEEYLEIVKKPRFGYGKNMNPCIDCRIFMLRKAEEYAKENGMSFIFTGEVLKQRPMSQHKKALDLIEKEAGLKGKVLRPLSAKLLPPTEAEKKGLVNRELLLSIEGRSRRQQLKLAEELRVTDFSCPGGGCLLTYREFACKVRDLFKHKKKSSLKDIHLLRLGRHFRFAKNKIIVGRNEAENGLLLRMKMSDDWLFEAQNTGSPTTLLQGPKTKAAIQEAAALTAYYSDNKEGPLLVKFGQRAMNKQLTIMPLHKEEVEKLSIVSQKIGNSKPHR